MHFRVNSITGGLCFVTAMLTSAMSAHAASAGPDSKPVVVDDESAAEAKDRRSADKAKAKEAKRADEKATDEKDADEKDADEKATDEKATDEKDADGKARKESRKSGKASGKSEDETSRRTKPAADEKADDKRAVDADDKRAAVAIEQTASVTGNVTAGSETAGNETAGNDMLPSTLSPVLTIGESSTDTAAADQSEATAAVAIDGEAEAAVPGSNPSGDNLLDDEVTEAPTDDARGDELEPTVVSPGVSDLPQPQGELLSGTRWSTPYYRMDSGVDGPTVVVVSGIHGDERSGPIAAERLLNAPLCSGVLYIIPRANQPALDTGTRLTPRVPHSNLNRNFPLEEAPPRGRLARNLWALVSDVDPDVLLDLHEGYDYNIQNGRSVGNTILYSPQEEEKAQHMVRQMVSAVNELETADQRFRAWKPPVVGSLARATAERLGSIAMILETTTRTDLDQRIDQHTVMVETALSELGMMGATCSDPPGASDVTTGELTADNGSANNEGASEAIN